MEVLEDRTVPSTVTWINSAGGDWDTASNWLDSSTNTNHTPGTIDDAVINTSGITVTHSSTSSVHNFTLSGATLSGAGSLVVNGLFTWAGTLTAGGVLTANGGMTGYGTLYGSTLNNAGYGILRGITTNNGAVLNNLATGTLDIQGDGGDILGAPLLNGHAQYVGAVSTFNNYGLLKKVSRVFERGEPDPRDRGPQQRHGGRGAGDIGDRR
jgi:hypothetical protein